MLAIGIIQEIRRLLTEGRLSQRKIAKLLGISRGTVASVAGGLRDEVPPDDLHEKPPERCPGCGARVYMPCLFCSAQAYAAKKRSSRSAAVSGSSPKPGPRVQSSSFRSIGTEWTKPVEPTDSSLCDSLAKFENASRSFTNS